MKKQIIRILLAGVIFAVSMANQFDNHINLILYLVSYVVIAYDVVINAVKNVFRGQMLDEHFLMAIASVGAFALGDYAEGVAVMLFYQVGETFQDYAVDKSRKSITGLMDLRADHANLKQGEIVQQVSPEQVTVGDIIIVKPGEKVPLDGVVLEGVSTLDTSALTGEALPREVEIDDEVLSGCINLNGLLYVCVTKEFGESTVAKILEMVENASSKKSLSEKFITRFARYYTPIVVSAAALLAIIPPMVMGMTGFDVWIHRALLFLVVSCPCALVISVPLSFFGGIGGASKNGILIKGSNYLEALAHTEVVVFDKTGTLTNGQFQVSEICPIDMDQDCLLEIAAHGENYSTHPIALSLKKAYGKDIDPSRLGEIEEIAGHGLRAVVDGKAVHIGNQKLMHDIKITDITAPNAAGTAVHIAIDGVYAGCIMVSDTIKSDAKQAMDLLRVQNVKKLVMLTGDKQDVAMQVAQQIGISEVYAQLLPGDKVEKTEQLMAEKSPKGKLAFVGDGINDAPVLARADIGVAMGALGSDAAIEAADVVLMTDQPSKLALAIQIARKTQVIVMQNIVFALGVKVLIMALGAVGIATMWDAVFADVGVAFIAILNALRALRIKNREDEIGESSQWTSS